NRLCITKARIGSRAALARHAGMLPAGFEPASQGRRPRILDRTRLREHVPGKRQVRESLRRFRVVRIAWSTPPLRALAGDGACGGPRHVLRTPLARDGVDRLFRDLASVI